jgi:hypothetical protein
MLKPLSFDLRALSEKRSIQNSTKAHRFSLRGNEFKLGRADYAKKTASSAQLSLDHICLLASGNCGGLRKNLQ